MNEGSKIKVRIELVGANQILFQVLEMDERFRATDKSNNEHVLDSNKFKIFRSVSSMDNPDIAEDDAGVNIWLRGGSPRLDSLISLTKKESLEGALEFISELKNALKDWAENWEGFQEEEHKNVQKPDCLTIFEF